MSKVNPICAGLLLFAVFMAGVAQIFLKKAAMSEHRDLLHEYWDWRVIVGYGLMFGCTFLNVIAYRGIPLSFGMVLETVSYINVTIFGVVIFKEQLTPKKLFALMLILAGIILYAV